MPRLPGAVIQRADLQQRMRAATAHGALWVCGPAGAGKTTAVAQWLRSTRRRACWLRLDGADSDPGVLLPRVREALAMHAGVSAPTYRYGPEHHDALEGYARVFLRTLFARLRKPLVLVLDNMQDVDTEVVETLFGAALQEAPDALTLIGISRCEPGARFSRDLAHQRLTLIPRDALKFSVDEAASLFEKRSLQIPMDSVARCREELDGWAVGLVFASDALRHLVAPAGWTAGTALDAPALTQYLAADVFDHLPDAEQTLLLATAYLARFCAAQAQTLSGLAACAPMLEQLHRNNGFIEADAGSPIYYRVHPVFRNFLQRRAAQRDRQPALSLPHLLSRSAVMLRDEGQWSAAGALYAQAQEYERLADMVESEAPALLRLGQDRTVVDLVCMIPGATAVWQTRPWLRFWHAQALAQADPRQACDAALQAQELFARGQGAQASLGAILAAGSVLSLHRAVRLDVQAPRELAERLETQFLAHWRDVPALLGVYAAAAYLSALSTLNRGAPIAPEISSWLLQTLQGDGPPDLRLRVAVILYEQFYVRNDLAGAHQVEVQAQALCAMPEARATAQRLWLVALSMGCVYQRRHDQAHAVLERAAELAVQWGDLEAQCQVNAWRIIVRIRLHRLQEALALELSGAPGFAAVPALVRATLLWAEGNLRMALRQYDAALARFEAAINLYRQTSTNVEQGPMLWLGQSVCHLMLGHHEAALESLQALLHSTLGGMARLRLDAFAASIRAVIAMARRESDADGQLALAMNALRETDYRDVLYGADTALADLCARALHLRLQPDFVDALVRYRQLEAPLNAPENWPYPIRILCLGELQVQTRDGENNERAMRKATELLQQVLAAAPPSVAIDALIAKLWPGDGREGAQKAFDAALHRLRKRLGHDGALRLSERRLSLNPGVVLVDLLALQEPLRGWCADDGALLERALRVMALYPDHFLATVDDQAVADQRARTWQAVRHALICGVEAANRTGLPSPAAQLSARLQALESSLA